MKKIHLNKSLLYILFIPLLYTNATLAKTVEFDALVFNQKNGTVEVTEDLCIDPSASLEDLKNLLYEQNKEWEPKKQQIFIQQESKFVLMDQENISDHGFENNATIFVTIANDPQLLRQVGILCLGISIGVTAIYLISLLKDPNQPKEKAKGPSPSNHIKDSSPKPQP